MKKSILKRFISLTVAAVMTTAMLAGCGAAKPKASFFTKGVYANYAKEAENPSKTYFYVFNDEATGHTEDGEYLQTK